MNLESIYNNKEVSLKGKIIDMPKCVKTPFGRDITEISLEIQNVKEKRCISVCDEGRFTKFWPYVKPGMEVSIDGRISIAGNTKDGIYNRIIINQLSFENCTYEENPFNIVHLKNQQIVDDYDNWTD